VVVFLTPASPSAPHRLTSDKQAYIRRGASSVPMDMRQIQDLTLGRARGAEQLEEIFCDRAAGFAKWWQLASGENGACRITAVPVAGFPSLPQFVGDPKEWSIRTRFRAHAYQEVDLAGPFFDSFRSIVRGQRHYRHDGTAQIEVLENGIADLWYRHPPVESGIHLFVGWLLGSYLCVLDAIDKMRSKARVPEWEFVIEFTLDGTTAHPASAEEKFGPHLKMSYH
jgi:hypothetical protein